MKRLFCVLAIHLNHGILRWWCLAGASGAWVPNKPSESKLVRSPVVPQDGSQFEGRERFEESTVAFVQRREFEAVQQLIHWQPTMVPWWSQSLLQMSVGNTERHSKTIVVGAQMLQLHEQGQQAFEFIHLLQPQFVESMCKMWG